MNSLLSIKDDVLNEVIIKKSKFITFLFRVDCSDDIKNHLDQLSLKYKDATHICYAYILDNVKRFSDDGEPGGTAGMPILNVLESKGLNHILCCVVRYFGGTKLGANGLVRAYSNGCCDALGCANIVSLFPGKICSIRFRYEDTKVIDNVLRDCSIINKEYGNDVIYYFKISINNLSILNNYDFEIIDDCFIEKNW